MKKIRLFFLLVLGFFAMNDISYSQQDRTDIWYTYLNRRNTSELIIGKNKYFAIASKSMYSVDKNNYELQKEFDRSNYLSNSNISKAKFDYKNAQLLVYYENGVIDIISANNRNSILDIAQSDNISNKNIKDIYINKDSKAFIYGELGLIELDMNDLVFVGRYFTDENVSSICINEDKDEIFVLVDNTIKKASIKNNLQDPSSWQNIRISNVDVSNTQSIASLGDNILLHQKNGNLILINNNFENVESIISNEDLSNIIVKELKDTEFGASIITNNKVYLIKDNLELNKIEARNDANYFFDNVGQEIAETDNSNKFYILKKSKNWQKETITNHFEGPADNNIYAMRYQNGKLMIVNGGRRGNRFSNRAAVSIFDKKWRIIDNKSVDNKISGTFRDPVDIIEHTVAGQKKIYVATWGEGIISFNQNLEVIEHFNTTNSTLETAITNSPNYIRVSSFSLDSKGILWMTQGSVEKSLVSQDRDGKWSSYLVPAIKSSNALGDIIDVGNDIKYVTDLFLTEHNEGFSIIKTKDNTFSLEDYNRHFSDVQEPNASIMNFSRVNKLVLDKNNKLWGATDIGFFIINNPRNLPKEGTLPIITRPVGGAEPPYYRILDNIEIKDIAVDAINQKWMATAKDGLYLLNEDGSEILAHYDMSNSPLLSNSINCLALDEDRGILYIGTSYGLNALYIASSQEQMEAKPSAIVYPNPLRTEDTDQLNIENIALGSDIKIFDSANRLIHSAISSSSIYKWNARDMNGNRLSSGVYSIIIYSPNNNKPQVLNVAIIN